MFFVICYILNTLLCLFVTFVPLFGVIISRDKTNAVQVSWEVFIEYEHSYYMIKSSLCIFWAG